MAQEDYARPRWFILSLFMILLSVNQLGLSLVIYKPISNRIRIWFSLNQFGFGLGFSLA